jgi:hypothetical protein
VLVVDLLEVIDINQQQRERRKVTIREREFRTEALVEVTPVVEPGEPVLHRRFVEVLAELLLEIVLVGELQDRRPAHGDLVSIVQDQRLGNPGAIAEGAVHGTEIFEHDSISIQDHRGGDGGTRPRR